MKNSKITLAIAATIAASWAGGVNAGAIGIDLTGNSTYQYFNSLSMDRDTGVDIDLSGDGDPTDLTPGEDHQFSSQAISGGGDDASNAPQDFNDAGGTLQFTKVSSIRDQVGSHTIISSNSDLVVFTDDTQVSHPLIGDVQLEWIVDNITDGTAAVKGDGLGSVECYGEGACSGAGGIDGDGTVILSAALIDSTPTSFLATAPGTGSGSFTLTYQIVSWDPAFIDVSNLQAEGLILTDIWSGTLVQPNTTLFPYAMWDGTPSSFDPGCGIIGNDGQTCVATNGRSYTSFQVDGSESFFGRVPEPGSLALLSIGLLGAGAAGARRRKKAA